MSADAECKKCKYAMWQKTGTGRSKGPGVCCAPPPMVVIALFDPPDGQIQQHRNRIWPDYKGRCDLFAKGG